MYVCRENVLHCVFSKILNYILDSGLSRFSLGFSECTQLQVKHQQNFQSSEKSEYYKEISNEHPVLPIKYKQCILFISLPSLNDFGSSLNPLDTLNLKQGLENFPSGGYLSLASILGWFD